MVAVFVIAAVFMMIIGIPVAASMGGASVLYILISGIEPAIILQKIFSQINSAALLAIPFFILAGDLMNSGGIAKRLMKLINYIVRDRTGGLAMVTIITCMFFAAISGSSVATASAVGALMIPEMVKNGYNKDYASSIVASAGPIGGIIPPSVPFVIYAVIANVSVTDLYKAGIPAGIMLGLGLMLVAYIKCKKEGYRGDPNIQDFQLRELFSIFLSALWSLGAPVILIGGVFSGIFTPTESAAVAVVYSIIVGKYIHKDMDWKEILRVLKNSVKATARIMWIISSAGLFAWVLAYELIPQTIAKGLIGFTDNKYIILLLINILYLIAGLFMETGATMIIMVPILLPIVTALGVDPVHFGIITTVNLSIGQYTPPFGVTMFTAAAVGNSSVQGIITHIMPQLIISIILLFIMIYFPQTVMFSL